jgi:5-methylcytosine-specific restriction endonuclease McrA
MSQHHLRTKHTSKSAAIRKSIEARLPLPCIEPRCLFPGQPVRKGDKWHVAHIVPAAQGGQTTLRNCGPAHAACNLQSGGRLGAAVTNIRRTTGQGRRRWV